MRVLGRSKIAIIGLGYVGLPLAVEFGKTYRTVGFDVDPTRIKELRVGRDRTLEATAADLKASHKLTFTTNAKELDSCHIFIVTVPTPIDKYKRPDLEPLIKASETIGTVLKKDDVVIYESTVFPGCTEEVYDAVVISVGHTLFKELGVRKIRALGKKTHLLFDVKYLFDANQTDQRL